METFVTLSLSMTLLYLLFTAKKAVANAMMQWRSGLTEWCQSGVVFLWGIGFMRAH